VRNFILAVAVPAAVLAAGLASSAATIAPGTPDNVLRLSPAHPIPTQVAGQPGPIRIDGCFSDGRGTDGLTLVHHALRVTNGGDRPITAIRVKFAFYDAFGDINATRTNIAEARIDPGQTADRINLAELSDAGPPARITCSVDAIRYVDGTIVRTEPGQR
jgi:hypothetical protein